MHPNPTPDFITPNGGRAALSWLAICTRSRLLSSRNSLRLTLFEIDDLSMNGQAQGS